MRPILLLTLDYPPQVGGVAAYLHRLVECFDPGEVQILAPPRDGSHEIDMRSPVPIYRHELLWRTFRPGWLPALYWTDWFCRKEGGPGAIVVSHLLPMGEVAYIVRRRRGIPYAVILHGMDAALALGGPSRKRAAARRILKAAAIVAVNSAYTAGLARALGADEAKIMIVRPSPGPVARIGVTGAARDEIRRKLAAEGESLVLTSGRLVVRKGFDTAIAAVLELRRRGRRVRLVIAGDGPEAERLRRSAGESGDAGAIAFVGQPDDPEMAGLLAAADLFVMTPRGIGPDVEGFGIVYLEANAFGKPVIGSRSGGVPEAVVDGQTGLLVPPNDVNALADAMERLLADRELSARLGEAGRRRVIEEFSGCRQMRPFVAALRQLAAERP